MPNDKKCPECDRRFRWYDNECPDCRVALVDTAADEPTPDAEIVSVFSTNDMALLPLAQLELEREGILYETKHSRWSGGYLQLGYAALTEAAGEPAGDAAELFVRAIDADRARELLGDLQHAAPVEVTEPADSLEVSVVSPTVVATDAPVALFDKDTGLPIGRLTLPQFDVLDEKLEHSSEDDDDFYVDEATLAMLEEDGVDAEVVQLLRHALAGRSGMDVRWVEE